MVRQVSNPDAVADLVDFMVSRGDSKIQISYLLYAAPLNTGGSMFRTLPVYEGLIGKYCWWVCFAEKSTGNFAIYFDGSWDELVRMVKNPPPGGPYR